MSKEMKMIPELRFPEFENDGNWELKNVEEFFDVGSSKRVLQKDWTNQGVPFYRTRELVSLSKNEPFGSEIFISEDLYEELKAQYGVPRKDDFLVSGVGTLGISYQVEDDDKFYFKDGNVLWFKLEGNLVSSYFKYCFESEHIQKQIVGQTSKSTVGTYTITNAKKTEFWYTGSPLEQQKIASCLTSLDELIAVHNDKLDTLMDHKKGLLQNLFPQEGETVPKVRFPEFEDDGEWVESKLEDNLEITSGYAFKSKFFSDSGRKLVTPKNFTKEGRANFIKEYTKQTTEDFKPKYLCKPGDLLVLLTDLTPSCELLGKPILLRNEDGEVLLNQRIIKLEVSKDLIKEFLFQFFLTSDFHRRVKSTASGTTVRHSSNKIILGTSLLIPRNTKEQKKIASFLSNLDELIAVQGQRIEQLQDHKKGLLQGLFPKIQF